MPDLKQQYMQLSIFDRLKSDTDYAVLGGKVTDVQVVRESVLRDVENLLNTRRSIIVPPESFHNLNHSLYVYGIDDFISKNPKSPEVRQALKTSIEETLKKFEPRLSNVAVEFNPGDGFDQKLCFKVKATLNADPVHEPIFFDTFFSADRGEYKIDNVQ